MESEQLFVGTTIVDGTMTVGQVALAVLRKHFLAMLAKEAGTREGVDPEELHDMRVATRRMRAAMGLFRDYLRPDVLSFREDLAWIGSELGGARDLDVQIEHFAAWGAEIGKADLLVPAIKTLAKRSVTAREEMAAALCMDRYKAFVERFANVLRTGGLPDGDPPVRDVAPRLLKRRMKRFQRLSKELVPNDPPEAFHAARIAGKRLRYAIEFVAAIYGKPAKDAAGRVVEVQDVLGFHQDCVVARGLVDELASEGPASGTAFALGLLAGHIDRLAVSLREQAAGKCAAVHGKEWRALREAMSPEGT